MARRGISVTLLDVAGLAAALSIRVRSSSASVVMERSALLRAMTACDDLEQGWRAHLARAARQPDGGDFYGLLEEMLSVDILLRTWAAFIASSLDSGRRPLGPQSAAAMLTRVLLLQRRRLLTTVIDSHLDFESLQQLDRHRRICERWSDVLLSVFPATATTRALKFDVERSREFADLWPSPAIFLTRTAEPVVVTALKSALPPLSIEHSPRREACAQLGSAIAASLSHDRRTLASAFQSHG